MIGNICFPTQKNCYATMWSYGEICVGCGCCGKPSIERNKARLEYWQYWLDHNLNFNHWCDDLQIRAIQEANINTNTRDAREKVAYYKRKVESAE